MKHQIGMQTLDALYDHKGTQNPLIEALPESLDPDSFFKEIRCCPPAPHDLYHMTMGERRQGLALLPTVFVPLDYMYYAYDALYRMLQSSYYTLTSRERVTRMNALFASDGAVNVYGTQAQSGALLDTPGLGKTTTLKRCLMLMPQMIAHEKYLDKPFFCKQVLRLFVECPSDASQKTMAYNIVHALDKAAGSAILEACHAMTSPDPIPLGQYRGFDMALSFNSISREYKVTLSYKMSYTVTLGTDLYGNITRIDNALAGIEGQRTASMEQLENTRRQLANAREQAASLFPQEDELRTKSARLDELNIALNLDKRENEDMDDSGAEFAKAS